MFSKMVCSDYVHTHVGVYVYNSVYAYIVLKHTLFEHESVVNVHVYIHQLVVVVNTLMNDSFLKIYMFKILFLNTCTY